MAGRGSLCLWAKLTKPRPMESHTAVNEGQGLNSWTVWPPWLVPVMERHPGAASKGHGLDVPGVGWVQQEKGFSGTN